MYIYKHQGEQGENLFSSVKFVEGMAWFYSLNDSSHGRVVNKLLLKPN